MEVATLKAQLGDGKPGTYILCLKLAKQQIIQIGKLGYFKFKSGYYYYVGSAFGPGGIAARCTHHNKISMKPHWHIDYLRTHCKLEKIVLSFGPEHLEHRWAKYLENLKETSIPVQGFGSSDCSCGSHLFFSGDEIEFDAVSQRVIDI